MACSETMVEVINNKVGISTSYSRFEKNCKGLNVNSTAIFLLFKASKFSGLSEHMYVEILDISRKKQLWRLLNHDPSRLMKKFLNEEDDIK